MDISRKYYQNCLGLYKERRTTLGLPLLLLAVTQGICGKAQRIF